jgi:entericidin B
MANRFLILLGMLSMLGALSACNTISGAGKDVEAAGGAITDTADETKEEMTK